MHVVNFLHGLGTGQGQVEWFAVQSGMVLVGFGARLVYVLNNPSKHERHAFNGYLYGLGKGKWRDSLCNVGPTQFPLCQALEVTLGKETYW
jgi:hypothetical protein